MYRLSFRKFYLGSCQNPSIRRNKFFLATFKSLMLLRIVAQLIEIVHVWEEPETSSSFATSCLRKNQKKKLLHQKHLHFLNFLLRYKNSLLNSRFITSFRFTVRCSVFCLIRCACSFILLFCNTSDNITISVQRSYAHF